MNKKEAILQAALQLFATYSYHSVATSKIAREAGVSEGLVFRHYQNKQGLLEAIMEAAKERIHMLRSEERRVGKECC